MRNSTTVVKRATPSGCGATPTPIRTNARRHHVDLTTRRTLVMEFMSGMTVLDYLRAVQSGDELTTYRLRAAEFEPNRFARHIIDNFLGDAFQYGVFHADLHPANLLILPQNVVGYVDFGITGVLEPLFPSSPRGNDARVYASGRRDDGGSLFQVGDVPARRGSRQVSTDAGRNITRMGPKAGKPVRRRSRKTSRW